jgi:ArsR family transcriptional regulator
LASVGRVSAEQRAQMQERLQRLIRSDVCDAEDVQAHRHALSKLVHTVAASDAMNRLSRFFKALADAKRLQILQLLNVRDMCVCELALALDTSQPNLSHHLRILEAEGVVSRRKKGKWAFYALVTSPLLAMALEPRTSQRQSGDPR